ncbi:HER014Wp [Eremothecium sinecaudum]|uniref:HER014Wp n=1 Tax=Eremothecium sinecaudum TaxID=45286 RepID=A0A0X8HTT9_9SACH|nr:HER014Wp [Eremothecium sinecaudum]AMD21293.1 HER014Wp [Eremothecium sinecaudum]
MSDSENLCTSLNALKRRPDDEEKTLEAAIKRVALDDESPPTNHSIDYVSMRMLCLVKQASMIVGPKGERISRIKEETKTRINVSENIKNVPERVIYIRGTCDNVAKAFGKISRAINGEVDLKSNERSLPLTVYLLIPHYLMGHIIGKQGSRLREIEDLSAARLVAGPLQLPMSNDRVLCITGVADAMHIATYYVGQTILDCDEKLKNKKTVFYQPSPLNCVLVNNYGIAIQHHQHHQYNPGEKLRRSRSRVPQNLPSAPNEIIQPCAPFLSGNIPSVSEVAPQLGNTTRTVALPYVRIVEITSAQPQPFSQQIQEIYIEDAMVGNVIGKGGKSITQIKQSSGSSIQLDEPKLGLKERRLTITGTPIGNQTAVMMINNKIDIHKRNQQRQVRLQHRT